MHKFPHDSGPSSCLLKPYGLDSGTQVRRKSLTAAPLPVCHLQPALGNPGPVSRNLRQHLACATRGGCEPRQRSPNSFQAGIHRLQTSCRMCWKRLQKNPLGMVWLPVGLFLKHCCSVADVMTQLEGLLLAEEA